MNQRHNHLIDKIAIINGFVTGLALYPQVVASILSGDVSGLSNTAFIIIFLNSIVWMLYGYHRTIKPLIVSSLLNCFAAGLLTFLIFNR